MFRASLRAGITTLTRGGSTGGVLLSSSRETEFDNRNAVTIGVTTHGRDAIIARVFPSTDESYARALAPDFISERSSGQPSLRLGTLGAHPLAWRNRAFEILWERPRVSPIEPNALVSQ